MAFTPERGDIVWLDLDPQAGREQAGRRPALVVSPSSYNGKVGLMLCCPVTNAVKNYPFEVPVKCPGVSGVVLSDHVKNLDWRARNADKICKVPEATLNEVIGKIKTLFN